MDCKGRRGVKGVLAAAAVLVGFAGGTVASAAPAANGPTVLYSAIPADLPGNVISLGFEATSTSEFGDAVGIVPGTGGVVRSVTVVMSSWGCESGTWYAATCSTTPGATFDHPITLNLYDNGAPLPGALLASVTETFPIPYRPSADPDCSGGRWQDENGDCFNGYATTITFELPSPGVAVGSEVIWSVAYNTTHHGHSPIGSTAACYTEDGGCGYDSLNVGAETLALVGTDLDEDGAYLDSTWGGAYCDGGADGTGVFREDTSPGCWTDYRPLAELRGATSDDCKNGGWQAFTDPSFKNQGQCVKFFTQLAHKKN